jgi:electron transport complex protein RnfC
MQTQADGVAAGANLIMRAVSVKECVVAIEENKPTAISQMRKAVAKYPGMRVEVLKKKYPQGGEKQLIEAVMHREVPGGALPVSVGAIVNNVATAYAVYEMVYLRKPLTSRVVTVTGPSLSHPGNFRVPLGTSISSLIEAAGGLPPDTGKVIAGGPMMGRAVSDLSSPSTKGLSGLLLLPKAISERGSEQACIRCGNCVHACPMGLEPYLFIALARNHRWEDMRQHLAMNCIECGSCAYVCPSSKPLLDFIKLGKQEIRKLK